MRTVHLIVATRDLKAVVAVRGDDGWRVPRVEAVDTVSRISLASQLRTRLDQMTAADLVHWAPLPWQDESFTDQYCAAIAHGTTFTTAGCNGTAAFLDREQILSDRLLPVAEHLAVRTALSRLERPVAPFDSHAEFVETLAWGKRQFAEVTGTRATTVTRYRGTRHDLVIRFQTGADAAYLKAGCERVPDEGVLTQHLRGVRPDLFPETLAIDVRKRRWLYREIPGSPLADLALTPDNILATVRALASLQVDTIVVPAIADHIAHRRRNAVELFQTVDGVVEHAWRSAPAMSADASLIEAWKTMGNAMSRICTSIDVLDVPHALVLSDLSDENVLMTPAGVAFIDVLNAYWSCPVLPLWRLVRCLEWRPPLRDPIIGPSIRQAIVESFVAEWARVVSPRAMRQAIAHLWLLGRLFGILMTTNGLNHYEEALGMELPASYRAARLAWRVRDLLRSFAERTLMPRLAEPDAASALDLR
jgi:hypothetical protein